MITFVRGTVFRAAKSCLDVDVAGVGYRAWVPERVALEVQVGSEVLLFTHHHIREDAQELYGFLSESDRDWFELLLGVSGIGPKGALQVVSATDYHLFVAAVSDEDNAYLCKLPGIGKKTAQRMILDLKDKVDPVLAALPVHSAKARSVAASSQTSLSADLVEALKSLGYNERQAIETVANVLQDETETLSLETALTRCLQRMDR